jgi:hypothetical protein
MSLECRCKNGNHSVKEAIQAGDVAPEPEYAVDNRRGTIIMDNRAITPVYLTGVNVATLDGWRPLVINVPISDTQVVEDRTYNSRNVEIWRQYQMDDFCEKKEKEQRKRLKKIMECY